MCSSESSMSIIRETTMGENMRHCQALHLTPYPSPERRGEKFRGCPKTGKPQFCHSVLDTESRGGDEVVWILAFARMTFSDSLLTTPPPSRREGGKGDGLIISLMLIVRVMTDYFTPFWGLYPDEKRYLPMVIGLLPLVMSLGTIFSFNSSPRPGPSGG